MSERENAALELEAAKLKSAGILGRSLPLQQLFDYLLEQSLLGHSPKELEVAQQVFGKEPDLSLDATVRVYVHRLRSKLDSYYGDRETDRLIVPRGEYRLVLARQPARPTDVDEPDQAIGVAPAKETAFGKRGWLFALVAASLLIGIAGTAAVYSTFATAHRPELADTRFWQVLKTSGRRTIIMVGDVYMFGRRSPDQRIHVMRDPDIHTRTDLDRTLLADRSSDLSATPIDAHYLPVSSARALRELIPVVDAVATTEGRRPRVAPISQVKPDSFKDTSLVYVGFLSSMGFLKSPVQAVSGFTMDARNSRLIDRSTGREFPYQEGLSSEKDSRAQYAYIASFPGPNDNWVLILAGTSDAAILQVVEIATDEKRLGRLVPHGQENSAFEALYRVETLDGADLTSVPIIIRRLSPALQK